MTQTPVYETEAEFQQAVIDLAMMTGWLIVHFPDSRRLLGHKGSPDLYMVRDGYLIFAELKTAKGKMSQVQWDWGWAIDAVARRAGIGYDKSIHGFTLPVRYFVWRPSDWDDISAILTAERTLADD